MADISVGYPNGEITAAGEVQLGEAHDGVVSSWLVQLTDNSSSSASITVKGRVQGQKGNAAFVAVSYKDMADGTVKTAAIATADLPALILIDAAGLDVQLDCTAISSGGVYFDAKPVLG